MKNTMNKGISADLFKKTAPRNLREQMGIKYDTLLIETIMASLRGLKPSDVTIFFDMDNTLMVYSMFRDDRTALTLQNEAGYFASLPCNDGARDCVKALKKLGFNVRVLSAASSHLSDEEEAKKDSARIREEKIASIRKNHLPFKKSEIIFTNNGENKSEQVRNMGYDLTKTILVDDYCKNLSDWIEAGGLAIKKSYYGTKKREIPTVTYLPEIVNIVQEVLAL